MRFIDTIVERDNLFCKGLVECSNNGYKTYILGAGEGAHNIERRSEGFCFAGKLVSSQYYCDNIIGGGQVECLEKVLESEHDKINIVLGCRGYNIEELNKWNDRIGELIDLDCFSGNYFVDPSFMSYSWVDDNQEKLQKVFDELADDYSREVFSAYINQKISTNYKYLRRVKTKPQYFEHDIIHLDEDEVFIDCGAYIGDSAESFISAIKENGIQKYKIVSFEPDPQNYEQMYKKAIPNQICINKGTSDHQGVINFSMMGTSSGINDYGEMTIETDTLDNMIDERVSFIKMDVEGSELASLRGARKLITSYIPKLAICIYHKKEDLWEIQDYLHELVPQYNFYVRSYEDTATELVLYAIPSSSNKIMV